MGRINQNQKKGKIGAIAVILSVLIILALAGAGFAIYSVVSNTLTPAKFSEAVQNTVNAESATLKGSIELTDTSGENPPVQLGFDSKVAKNGDFESINSIGSTPFSISFDLKAIGDQAYFKVDGIGDILAVFGGSTNGILPESTVNGLSAIDNMWYLIDASAASTIGLDETEATKAQQNLNDEQLKQFREAYSKSPFFELGEISPDDYTVEDVATWKVDVSINREALLSYLEELRNIQIDDESLINDDVYAEATEFFTPEFLDGLDITFYVGKDNPYIYRIETDGVADGMTFDIDVSMLQFDEDFEIVPPTESKTFQQLFEELNIEELIQGFNFDPYSSDSIPDDFLST